MNERVAWQIQDKSEGCSTWSMWYSADYSEGTTRNRLALHRSQFPSIKFRLVKITTTEEVVDGDEE